MSLKYLVLSAFLVVLCVAGCGKPPATAKSVTGTPSSPSSPTTATAISVTSPAAGAAVSSPFAISATANTCQAQAVDSIGYSIDQGSATAVQGTALNSQASATAGSHTLHVIASGVDGSSCKADVAITVSQASQPSDPDPGPIVPDKAITVTEIQQFPGWQGEFDARTGSGSAKGVMSLVSSPSLSGSARRFETSFANKGGERYHVGFGADSAATHFVYDAWLYLASPSDSIANIELDMNQVLANGQTVIYGFQCSGYSHTWEITENSGTPAAPDGHWVQTAATCDPRNWSPDAWHHVQVAYSREDAGNVTYESVWFDGAEQKINQTVQSSFALGWAPVLLTNLQVDGRGASGSNTVYLDSLSVSRW